LLQDIVLHSFCVCRRLMRCLPLVMFPVSQSEVCVSVAMAELSCSVSIAISLMIGPQLEYGWFPVMLKELKQAEMLAQCRHNIRPSA